MILKNYKMRIKKHNSGNEYIYAGDVWVRNFCNSLPHPLQLSQMFTKDDYQIVLKNEEMNKNHPKISDEKIIIKKIIIVSDGYDFESRHKIISELPKDIGILVVNKAYQKWKLLSTELSVDKRRPINAFVINNPYADCMNCLPSKDAKYYPTCVASNRTNYEFLKKYKGQIYNYFPSRELKFGLDSKENYYIDDYRNPICASIGLAYKFDVKKLLLLCCDDSFKEKREYSIKMKNGMYTYPHHIKCHEIIDANLYWLSNQESKEVKIADFSSGPEYNNAINLKNIEDIYNFFEDNNT